MQRRLLTSTLAAAAARPVSAHRPLLPKGSCDDDFGSASAALRIPDPTISWAFNHYMDCTHRALWMNFTNPSAAFKFYVGVGIPPQDRFAALRANALIIGPGLPPLSDADSATVPDAVRDSPVWRAGTGALFHRSPADQSTCAHLGSVMTAHSRVVDYRCDFFEPFGRTNSWRVLDADENEIPQPGETYHVAVWLQGHTSGKLGVAVGTWKEDFRTPMDLVTPSCSRDMQDFSEKGGAQLDCFPVVACPAEPPISRAACAPRGVGAGACPDGARCDGCETTYLPTMGCGGKRCPAATALWDATNMKMHRGMAIAFSGDASVDFVRGMIPHHIGAVDMCTVLIDRLECAMWEDAGGADGLVHFCNHVRREQEREVSGMRTWLSTYGHAEAAPCGGGGHSSDEDASAVGEAPEEPQPQGGHGGHGGHGAPAPAASCQSLSTSDCITIGYGRCEVIDTTGDGSFDTCVDAGTGAPAASSSAVSCQSLSTSDCITIGYGRCDVIDTTGDGSFDTCVDAGTVSCQSLSTSECITTGFGRCEVIDTTGDGSFDACVDAGAGSGSTPSTPHSSSAGAEHAHGMSMGCGDTAAASSAEYIDVNAAMHEGMSIDFSCDHRADFVRGMIPHHAGAVAMCRVLRRHTHAGPHSHHDTASGGYLGALCANITYTQLAEIAWLSQWLAARGHALHAPCGGCADGAEPAPPPLPCEDTLPASSFCHLLGGHSRCRCGDLTAQHACGTAPDIPGFAVLNVSAECHRECGLCRERPPLFHSPCGAGGGGHDGHGSHAGSMHGGSEAGSEHGDGGHTHVGGDGSPSDVDSFNTMAGGSRSVATAPLVLALGVVAAAA